jgi:hypothetical protein
LKPDAAAAVRSSLHQVWIDGLTAPPRSTIDQALLVLLKSRLRLSAVRPDDDRPVPTAGAAFSDQEVADLAHDLFSQAAETAQRSTHRLGLWDIVFRRTKTPG